MKKSKWILIFLLALLLVLQACNWPGVEFSGEISPIDDTTGSSGNGQGDQSGGDSIPTDTDAPPPPPENTATPTNTPENTPVPTATTICDLAGFVIDVNVPDGSKADPGQHFTKTWRLRNAGSCTWTSGYDVVFSSGDAMGAPPSTPLTTGTVAPGETVDASVALVAPSSSGTYKGFFKLRNSGGVLFGLAGGNPFWVEIEVRDLLAPPPVQIANINFTAGYAGGWMCSTQFRRSLKIKNTGTDDLESMKIRLEGPIGTYLNGFSNNAPFRPVPPEPHPQCVQAGSDKLSSGNTAWVSVHTNSPPPGGTPGRIIVKFCGEESLGGLCKEVIVNFTW
jgi:hypothetical protein